MKEKDISSKIRGDVFNEMSFQLPNSIRLFINNCPIPVFVFTHKYEFVDSNSHVNTIFNIQLPFHYHLADLLEYLTPGNPEKPAFLVSVTKAYVNNISYEFNLQLNIPHSLYPETVKCSVFKMDNYLLFCIAANFESLQNKVVPVPMLDKTTYPKLIFVLSNDSSVLSYYPDEKKINEKYGDKAFHSLTKKIKHKLNEINVLDNVVDTSIEFSQNIIFYCKIIPLQNAQIIVELQQATHKHTENIKSELNVELHNSLFELSPESIVILSISGKIIDCNNAFSIMSDMEREELIGKHFSQLTFFRFKQIIKYTRIFINFLITKNKGPYYFEWIHKDGTMHFGEAYLGVIKKNNKLIGIQAITKDITKQKKTQNALVESERNYKSLYQLMRLMCDNVPDLIWAKDINNNYLFANKAICEKLLNATDTDEPIGKSDLFFAQRQRELYPSRNDWHTFGEICQNSDEIVKSTKIAQRFDEFGNVRGEFLFLDVYKAPFLNDKNELIGTVGCGRLVTKEKELENEKVLSVQKLEQYAKNQNFLADTATELLKYMTPNDMFMFVGNRLSQFLPEYILTVSAFNKDNSYMQVKYVGGISKFHERIFQFLKKDLYSLKIPVSEQRQRQIFDTGKKLTLYPNGLFEASQHVIPKKAAKSIERLIKFNEIYGINIFEKDKLFGTINIITKNNQVVENKEIIEAFAYQVSLAFERMNLKEELIVAKEKAEESDKLKSAFLANMSHEVRTPLNGILGFIKMLGIADLSEEKRNKYIEIINESGGQLLDIITDIIDMSKIESGQIDVYQNTTNIHYELKELERKYKRILKEKHKGHIKLTLDLHLKDESFFLKTDEIRLQQVLTKLLNNAVKFTEEGEIKFGYKIMRKEENHQVINSSQSLHIALDQPLVIQFYVKDTGVGISKKMQKVIFDRFRQEDDSSTRQYGGTGLGLTISKALIEKLDGEIWLESEKDVGTTLFFYIPFQLPDGSSPDFQVNVFEKQINWKNKKVLIVEDNEIGIQFFTEMLSDTQIEILIARTGAQALEVFKAHNDIDLILMDVQLPDTNGYEVTDKIKKMKNNIPVIAQTAHAFAEDRITSFDRGCDGYISKPIDVNELLKIMDSFLAEKSTEMK